MESGSGTSNSPLFMHNCADSLYTMNTNFSTLSRCASQGELLPTETTNIVTAVLSAHSLQIRTPKRYEHTGTELEQ
jgi:hypothetical protein